MTENERTLRERVFVMEPARYDIRCDLCGGTDVVWSEYERMIWCYDCEKDTVGTGGIFDGPVPVGATGVLGLSLDMVDLETGQRLTPVVNKETHEIEYVALET